MTRELTVRGEVAHRAFRRGEKRKTTSRDLPPALDQSVNLTEQRDGKQNHRRGTAGPVGPRCFPDPDGRMSSTLTPLSTLSS